MIQNVLETISAHRMFDIGDKVIVGVSGGPDSMCLLHILHTYKEKMGIKIIAAHINHCLRGEEADKDEEYVKEFCSKIGIEFYSKRIDINKMSKEKGISGETAGREARYGFFYELFKELNCHKIALAHNANDQAETILMRIMRGTGMDGLVGIKPVRDKIIVRPLINSKRQDIEEYCSINSLSPRIDKTNLENIYNRNKVRLELIPYIQENFNSDIVSTLNRMAETIAADNGFLEQAVLKRYEKYCENKEEKVIIKKKAFLEPYSIISRLVRISILKLVGNLNNFERTHVEDILELSKLSTGKKSTLPSGIVAVNSYGDIHIYRHFETQKGKDLKEYKLYLNSTNMIEKAKLKVKMKVARREEIFSVSKEELKKYFDLDKVNKEIILRYRREGDKFSPLGFNGSKKLKDFFIDMKIPKEERDEIPLICFGDEIAWVVGYRISERFKVDEATKSILEIEIEREEL